jgi:hypothetical protein
LPTIEHLFAVEKTKRSQMIQQTVVISKIVVLTGPPLPARHDLRKDEAQVTPRGLSQPYPARSATLSKYGDG